MFILLKIQLREDKAPPALLRSEMNEYLLQQWLHFQSFTAPGAKHQSFLGTKPRDLPTGHHSGTSTRVLSVISLLINFLLITEAISDTGKKTPFFLPALSQDVSLSHPKAVPRGEFPWASSPGPFPAAPQGQRNNEGFSPGKPAQSSVSLEQQKAADKQEESTCGVWDNT